MKIRNNNEYLNDLKNRQATARDRGEWRRQRPQRTVELEDQDKEEEKETKN